MNTPRLKLGLTLAAGALLAGCAPTLTIVPHMAGCELGDALRASKCAAPQPIADNATYSALVDAMLVDRQALRECGLSLTALRASLQRCNQATADFNNKIDVINAGNKAGN